uniref:Nucleoside phosphorylase domain-containing protein n=1 Tax=Oryza glumipatula TaxID=40148 RepID=A0A0D9Y5L1_9ORYZ
MAMRWWPVLVAAAMMATAAEGFISAKTWSAVRRANDRGGPFVGLVVPNANEMDPVLNSPSFTPTPTLPSYLDIQGRRFRFGAIGGQNVVMVMTGLSMLNAGLTTQLLLSLFRVKGIVHWGIAGNADEGLQIGDVTIPEHWAHLSLWNWQRYGDGPENELPRSRPPATTPATSASSTSPTKPSRSHCGMELPACVNATTCLPRAPRVTRVRRGCSANVFLDNAAYRQFLRAKFGCTPVEMESAAVALVAHQHAVPFLTIRSLSDLAGGGSSLGNEAGEFLAIAAQNAVDVMLNFVPLLADGGAAHDAVAADM